MLDYDKNVFEQNININFSKMRKSLNVTEIYNIQLKRGKKYREIYEKIYFDNFKKIKNGYNELVKFDKYLDIYYTIHELNQESQDEYIGFVNKMKNIIDDIDQHYLDELRNLYRTCLSIKQYYNF
jgi:hypothetical protein